MAANNPTPDKPTCHVRRHLTPSQFMTYDAMRAMAKKDDCGDLICYARLTTITNHTSIGKTQNQENIKALTTKGWLVPRNKARWNRGRWANNTFIVFEHPDYEKFALDHEEPYEMCPPFKFDTKTGENLMPDETWEAKAFAIDMALAKVPKEPSVLADAVRGMTHDEREEWFDNLGVPDGEREALHRTVSGYSGAVEP